MDFAVVTTIAVFSLGSGLMGLVGGVIAFASVTRPSGRKH